jgi:methyltransferase (TIGR00027 family)
MEQTIHHVADTAHWIAAFRARESERPDAVFRDPLAARLAGERGFAMVDSTPFSDAMAFAMVARTTGIDRLVLSAIGKNIDTVINLGAGLDTRPYRMALPASLKWIEVDFPSTIDYKNTLLAAERPVCKLKRIACDLSSDEDRRSLFKSLGTETRRALVITEGVIVYLTNEQAEALSTDLYSVPTFSYWIMDFNQGRFRRNRMSAKLKKIVANAPFRFTDGEPLKFFARQGWIVDEKIFILDQADLIGRKPPLKFPYSILRLLAPRKLRELGNKT